MAVYKATDVYTGREKLFDFEDDALQQVQEWQKDVHESECIRKLEPEGAELLSMKEHKLKDCPHASDIYVKEMSIH